MYGVKRGTVDVPNSPAASATSRERSLALAAGMLAAGSEIYASIHFAAIFTCSGSTQSLWSAL